MTLDRINLVVSTIWREGNYLDSTLNSLREEYPVGPNHSLSLVAGSPVTTHLDCYRSHPGITVVEMGPNTWSWIKNNRILHRAAWNYYRCLTQPFAGERGTLVIEDDIRFARGWWMRLESILVALEEHHGTDFVLALYAPWFFPQEGYQHGQLYVEYPLKKFYGTQAIYYTAKTRQGFAKYLKIHGVVALENIYDFLLREYLLQSGLPLFAAAPSLVQHIGERSAIGGTRHTVPGFVENVTGNHSG